MWHLTFALAVSGVVALSVPPRLVPRSLTTLHARQSLDPSQFPPACQTPCGPVISDLSTCTTNACTCTTKVAADYQTCLNCLGELAVSAGINNASISADVQNAATSFNQQCASANLPPITVPAGVTATSLGGSLGGGPSVSASVGAFPSNSLPSGGGITTDRGQGPSFSSSSLSGLGGGGGGGGLPLATQTAATLPPAGGVGATSTGLLSGTPGAKTSTGYKDGSARLAMVAVGLIGAAVPYLC